ncbi:MAG: hypothetical protein IJX28_02515 [Clostridia bacterium]|nr:hypothetical protein [Clostridia bacterium]
MRNLLSRFRYELCALLLAAGLGQIVIYWRVRQPADPRVRALLIVLGGLGAVLLLVTLRKLWRTKWRRAILSGARTLLAKASRFMLKLLDKWNLTGRGKQVLRGKTTVSFDFSVADIAPKKRPKPKKWKHLRTNREKMGYLYRHMLTARIKSGMTVHSCDTPAELKEKAENAPHEEALFDLYLDTRYDERTDNIPDDTIDHLKDAFAIK